MKKAKVIFRNEKQERIFKYILKVAQNLSREEYEKNEGKAKAVLELPSISAEYAAVSSFKTEFKSCPSQFLVKVEFWLRTVFPKLEDAKLTALTNVALQAQQDPKNARSPFDFVLLAMSTEPDPTVYAYHKAKEKEKKALNAIDWQLF